MTYANEIDPFAAEWLARVLPGTAVDRRSIRDVKPDDVAPWTRAHFFAGIGGWELALRWAGWPEDRPVWTGSCPCQPFSVAGKGKGQDDDRHLWPEFLRLIRECRPPTIFGEQVASAAGRIWLSGVRVDLEALGYAVGAVDLCAAGVGAPHIRQRLFWVAHALPAGRTTRGAEPRDGSASGGGAVGGMADALDKRRDWKHALLRPEEARRISGEVLETSGGGTTGGLADAHQPGLEGRGSDQAGICPSQRPSWARCWDDAYTIDCIDGKTRRVGSGVFPLAHGVPSRLGRLRAYGNAIVPALAAEFVRAFLDAEGEL